MNGMLRTVTSKHIDTNTYKGKDQELVCRGADVGNKEQHKVRTHLQHGGDLVEDLCKKLHGFESLSENRYPENTRFIRIVR